MKKGNIIKISMLFILFIISSLNLSAKQSKDFVYDSIEKNGILIGQTIYKCNENLLERFVQYNYVFNDENRIIENNILKWNSESKKWEKGASIRYTYANNTITTKYYKWDSNKQDYILIPKMSSIIEEMR